MLRILAHAAAWLPFVVGPARTLASGWRPVGDGAAIALRSWNELTAHASMVGQATRLAHGVFDPGPLEYWLLAVPVHDDPRRGVLWGAALCCLAAASLAVEAAWSAGGELAGLGASAVVGGLALRVPGVALVPEWNPWFGMMFFLASLAAGWAVMAGHRRWWPVLVVTASVAAQAHLMFALGSAALVLAALGTGVADSIRARSGYWWLPAGLVAGAACWSAPAIQQVTMRSGNISALLRSVGGNDNGPRTGLGFGLKALASATTPPPLWWQSPTQWQFILRQISGSSAGLAVAMLILVAAAGIAGAWPLRRRWLTALAGVTLILSLAALATYASIPVRSNSLSTLNYLIILVLPVGVLTWLVLGSALVLAARAAWPGLPLPAWGRIPPPLPARGRILLPLAARGRIPLPLPVRGRVPFPLPAAAVAAGALVIAAAAVGHQPGEVREITADPVMREVPVAAGQVVRALPGQQIALLTRDHRDPAELRRFTLALTWALTPPGYLPELARPRLARELGAAYVFRCDRMPLVTVAIRRNHRIYVRAITDDPLAARDRTPVCRPRLPGAVAPPTDR
ncbi:MAG: hypothetical protein J2P32_12195 [Actinobacteria bacterium]|nr:hypothetical protein [Actinomycetota bacterium]